MLKHKYSKLWYFVGVLAAANLALWTVFSKPQNTHAQIYIFDVGQGDAIYLRTPQGNDILIDGGPGDTVLSKLGRAMAFGDRNIELMVLTHPHADHVSGLVEVLKRYKVRQVMLPKVTHDSATYKTFMDHLADEKATVITPRLGQRLYLDDFTVFDIYYPVVGEFSTPPSDINDSSIVGKISLGESNILLTGDAGQEVENLLLRAGMPLKSEILKVGHHGSRHSSAPEFLKAAGFTHAVISVGKNSYGHPREEVLTELRKLGNSILRTDEAGDIAFEVYPQEVRLQR